MRCFSCSLLLLERWSQCLPNRLEQKEVGGLGLGVTWAEWVREEKAWFVFRRAETSACLTMWFFIKTTTSPGAWSFWLGNIFHQLDCWGNLRRHRGNWSNVYSPISSSSDPTHEVLHAVWASNLTSFCFPLTSFYSRKNDKLLSSSCFLTQ